MSDLPVDLQAGDPNHVAHHNALHARYNESGTVALETASLAVAFDTADVLTGLTIATLHPGDALMGVAKTSTEAFDGATPYLEIEVGPDPTNYATLDATTVDFDNPAFPGTDLRSPIDGEIFFAWTLGGGYFIYVGNATTDVTVRLDDGNGGDPGSAQGHAKVTVLVMRGFGDLA